MSGIDILMSWAAQVEGGIGSTMHTCSTWKNSTSPGGKPASFASSAGETA
jgi:hypothetical protein